jgi:hypothetical protein
LIFWLLKLVLSVHQWKYAGIHPSIVYFSPPIGMLSHNLKHNNRLHSSWSLPFDACWMTPRCRASSGFFLLLAPWIAPSLAICALSLLDCLWSTRSVAALWITTYYGLRLLSWSSKDHWGFRRSILCVGLILGVRDCIRRL